MKYNDRIIDIGTKAEETRLITQEIVDRYADLSGDKNPVHINDEYATKSIFGAKIAHGLFCLGMISKIIGMDMPGEGSILVNENINYRKPVFIGDSITTAIEVIEIREKKNMINLKLQCTNQNCEIVLDGTTLVKVI